MKLFAWFLTILIATDAMGVARLYDRNTNDIIDADKDDAEWDNTNNALNTHTADTAAHSVSGAVVGTSSTQTLTNKTIASPTITGSATINQAIITGHSANTSGWTNNLGLSLSGGTLTIVDADGTALSSTNMGWVTTPSSTAGQLAMLQVNAPASINDDVNASSDLTNLAFGIGRDSAWANDLYFYLYVANRNNANIDGQDGNSVFFLARSPAMAVTPATEAKIGDTANIPTTDGADSIIILDDVTTTDYESLPVQIIGGVRMRWDTSTDDWTFQSLTSSDGIGWGQLEKVFATLMTFPANQNGANSTAVVPNSHWQINGATDLPDFTTEDYFFKQTRDGRCQIWIYYSGDGGDNGSGANNSIMSLPVSESGLGADEAAYGVVRITDGANARQAHATLTNTGSGFTIEYPTSATAISVIQYDLWNADAGRLVETNFEYECWLTNPS